MFIDDLKDEALQGETNYSLTENGALAYKDSGKKLVNLNYAVSNMRKMHSDDILKLFRKAFYEDKELALKFLFYLGDIREGLGERRAFRIILRYLATEEPEILRKLIPYIAEYNRFDSILELLNTSLHEDLINYIREQLAEDGRGMHEGKSISLMAKWLPRTDCTNQQRRKIARQLALELPLERPDNEKKHVLYQLYNKQLTQKRDYLDVIERKTSQNKWGEIDYNTVPSKANLKYSTAFFRHDEERRTKFLDEVKKGIAKINAGVLYPYDIVREYNNRPHGVQTDLEMLWENLNNVLPQTETNLLVVCDGSASMTWNKSSGSLMASTIAQSLAIYCAERIKGQFCNTFITFSQNPRIINLNGENLYENLKIIDDYTECSNTDIYKTFKLILNAAINHSMPQEDMPDTILILSDMQFDSMADFSKPLFKKIQQEFADAGYRLPKVVFWNLCGANDTLPVTGNEYGFGLVSGFSVNILKAILQDEIDPYMMLVNVLRGKRYEPIKIYKD